MSSATHVQPAALAPPAQYPAPEALFRGTFNETYGTPEDFQTAITELRKKFPSEGLVTTDSDVLRAHGYTHLDLHPELPPTVVVYPQSTAQVVEIVQIANRHRMPVIPYSAATSLEGHCRATPIGGIAVDMTTMNRILEVHAADADVVCQPGLKWVDLNETLKNDGIPLFFPLDPSPGATIGGMLSTGCSGTNAVRFGTAKGEWFLNATIVLPNGEVIKTRQRSRKCSAGFDTTKLFIGAEGTLGIVTEVTVRLAPLLNTAIAVVHFPDVRSATTAVGEILTKTTGIQCAELCDNGYMRNVNRTGLSPIQWPELDTILFKFQGSTTRSIEEVSDVAREISAKYGGTGFRFAKDAKEEADIWAFRKMGVLWIRDVLCPSSEPWATDVCVPVTSLPDLVSETKKDIDNSGIVSAIIGHVGDGNFHAALYARDEAEIEACRQIVHRMNKRAIALDGTCTGEHGVGIGKRGYLNDELGEGTVALMKTIKKALDPYNLFNPGKLYPH